MTDPQQPRSVDPSRIIAHMTQQAGQQAQQIAGLLTIIDELEAELAEAREQLAAAGGGQAAA